MGEIRIRYKNWNDITLSMADDIQAIASNDELSTAEKDIAIVALLCDAKEEEIWGLSVDEVNALREEVLWIGMPSSKRKNVGKVVKIGAYTLEQQEDITQMTYSQYVDFETYIKAEQVRREDILTTILIPSGHKYNDGYDIKEVRDAIYKTLSVADADSILFFFTQRLVSSIRRLASSLEKKRTMSEEERRQLRRIEEETTLMLGYLS